MMNNEVEWIWKEAVVAQLRYYPGIYLEVQEKTTTEQSEEPVSRLRFELGTYIIQVHTSTGIPTRSPPPKKSFLLR